MADRAKEHNHIVDAACEHAADQNPQQPWHITELRGKHRSKQRTGRGNGGKVVPEEHVLICGDIVLSVRITHSGRLTGFIDIENFLSDEQTIEAVCDRKNAESGENNRYSVHAG